VVVRSTMPKPARRSESACAAAAACAVASAGVRSAS
jgi:hypothetical protein